MKEKDLKQQLKAAIDSAYDQGYEAALESFKKSMKLTGVTEITVSEDLIDLMLDCRKAAKNLLLQPTG